MQLSDEEDDGGSGVNAGEDAGLRKAGVDRQAAVGDREGSKQGRGFGPPRMRGGGFRGGGRGGGRGRGAGRGEGEVGRKPNVDLTKRTDASLRARAKNNKYFICLYLASTCLKPCYVVHVALNNRR